MTVDGTVSVAEVTPLAVTSGTTARTVVPDLKVTLPVGVAPETAGVTTALIVIDWPRTGASAEGKAMVVVAALATGSDSGPDVLVAARPSPA